MTSNENPFDTPEQISAAMEDMPPIALDVQVACVRREIGMRERVYPRWVATDKMTPKKADDEIAAMKAVLATLVELQEKERLL